MGSFSAWVRRRADRRSDRSRGKRGQGSRERLAKPLTPVGVPTPCLCLNDYEMSELCCRQGCQCKPAEGRGLDISLAQVTPPHGR